jgi:hypothetical protein
VVKIGAVDDDEVDCVEAKSATESLVGGILGKPRYGTD